MKEVIFQEILDKARYFAKQDKKWHFHMLAKSCQFNEHRGKYSILLEEEETNEPMNSLFTDKPINESKKLADLLYGKGFLEEKRKDKQNRNFDLILKKAEELTAHGIEWHHHHLPPNCILNEHKGKHCIVLEDPKTQKLLTAVYDQKPMSDLAKIEKLFYRDVKW